MGKLKREFKKKRKGAIKRLKSPPAREEGRAEEIEVQAAQGAGQSQSLFRSETIDGPRRPSVPVSLPGAAYEAGDLIGGFEVRGVLGAGGFGVVYLVYSPDLKSAYALKTFRNEYFYDERTRELFRKEARIWVELEKNPFVVQAHFVDEIAGQLYIALEYIAPGENGLNSLEGYLERLPPDLPQSLRWSIQFCHGMEHAISKGIRCHRDIKPANIMIGQDGAVKVSDFGLAGVIEMAGAGARVKAAVGQGVNLMARPTSEGTAFGTLTHMPPEQFNDAARCDERSDVYSFGVVLYQMATGGTLPFLPSSAVGMQTAWQRMRELHEKAPVPETRTPLAPIIRRCLEKEPDRRYQSFKELRADLEQLLGQETGEAVEVPRRDEMNAFEWSNKGASLCVLGHYDEAVGYLDKATQLVPDDAGFWYNKGECYRMSGRYAEAVAAYNEAVKVNPKREDAWFHAGLSLAHLGKYEEAIRYFDEALRIDPRDAGLWHSKGTSLFELARYEEALECFDKTIRLAPSLATAWYNKGNSLLRLNRPVEGIQCFTKSIRLNPHDPFPWYNKATTEAQLNRRRDAAHSFRQFLSLVPGEHSSQVETARTYLSLNG